MFCIGICGFPIDKFSMANMKLHSVRWNYLLVSTESKISCALSYFIIHSGRTLKSFGHTCINMHTDFINFFVFFRSEKNRDEILSINAGPNLPCFYSLKLMISYIPLETAAIFFLANVFLKQDIISEYVMIDFCMGILGLQGAKTENYKMKNSCP